MICVAWQSLHDDQKQSLPLPAHLMCVCVCVCGNYAKIEMQRIQFNCGQSSSIVSQMIILMMTMMLTITRCNRLSSNYVVAWIPFRIDCNFIHSIRCVRKRTCMYEVLKRKRKGNKIWRVVVVFPGDFHRFWIGKKKM